MAVLLSENRSKDLAGRSNARRASWRSLESVGESNCVAASMLTSRLEARRLGSEDF
jgi:hypothetical protein